MYDASQIHVAVGDKNFLEKKFAFLSNRIYIYILTRY
jgi:hypothetical protein